MHSCSLFSYFLDFLACSVEEGLQLQLRYRQGRCGEHPMEPGSDVLLDCGSRHRLLSGRFLVDGLRDRRLVGVVLKEQWSMWLCSLVWSGFV